MAVASIWSQTHRKKENFLCPTSMNSNFMMKTGRKVSFNDSCYKNVSALLAKPWEADIYPFLGKFGKK